MFLLLSQTRSVWVDISRFPRKIALIREEKFETRKKQLVIYLNHAYRNNCDSIRETDVSLFYMTANNYLCYAKSVVVIFACLYVAPSFNDYNICSLNSRLKAGTHYPCSRAIFTGRKHGPWKRVWFWTPVLQVENHYDAINNSACCMISMAGVHGCPKWHHHMENAEASLKALCIREIFL